MTHRLTTSSRALLLALLAAWLLCSATACWLDARPAGATQAKPFGIKSFTMQATAATIEKHVEVRGEAYTEFINMPYQPAFTQAGGHPWALTTTGEFTTETLPNGAIAPTRDPKDIVASLPPGLLGNPMAMPQCPLAQFTRSPLGSSFQCPADTQVGYYRLRLQGESEIIGPVINLVPSAGESAEFGLENTAPEAFEPLLTAHLVHLPQGGYGFTVVSDETPLISLTRFEVTFWGVPADPSHDALRGRFCRLNQLRTTGLGRYRCEPPGVVGGGFLSAGVAPTSFLSLGSDCAGGPEVATLRADSWEEPGSVREGRYSGFSEATAVMPALTGCGALAFPAGVEVQPDTLAADEPVGLGVDVTVPQNEQPGTLATPHLRDATVTLPEGVSISPGVVDGVQACNESGPEGINFEGPESEEVGLDGELHLAAGHCPGASVVGTAEAVTPLLPEPVKGHVYLARPLCGGAGQAACTNEDALDGNLYQLYLELGGTGELAKAGINIKARGFTEANPATGQLTTKFLDNPQTPFSELKIHLNGGPRAPLANPAACGPAVTTSDFTPWSAPGVTPEGTLVAGTADATPSSFYEVSGCEGAPGLAPGFSAGTVSPQAGAFTAFTLNFSRQDREQDLSAIQVHTPPGLLGMLSSVPLCGEPQASQGTCPAASQIGTTRVASGAGSHPFEIDGNVYLTTGYKGAPFGLSIVTNAVAGPFNLGLVVVRAQISVDPQTSALTVTSDPLPQIIFGVPLRLQRVSVNIDRPGFMFNPTNCDQQHVSAQISGTGQAVATVASPFAASDCKGLAFKPSFTVSTSGHTSRAGGASLDARVAYPAGSMGSQANIAYVKVQLPRQLPSRLSTLQKACPAAVFQADPGGCPAASIVGIARASTPILPVGLAGPVYFVSHGGEAFPSLIVVLQGDGVRVDLTGSTLISAQGITSSTFKTVPDVPVETFELYLPEGPYSALAANANLCRAATQGKLVMPTEMLAQNGAAIRQSTKIDVTGCAHSASRKKHHKKRARGRGSHNAKHGRRTGQ
ncbi:MAG TPA: hypothetical protein VGL57_04575 [Solirubrobacteraceae bacterium]